jgi:hypothetical protein
MTSWWAGLTPEQFAEEHPKQLPRILSDREGMALMSMYEAPLARLRGRDPGKRAFIAPNGASHEN